ncbi:DMT family transporter [Candidatus Salinivivens marinus]|uniref:DMT family transporter n=1 Tax=Candidatus Salinivivens marinus TaxID=3381703 RepID=UPI003F696492|tara:strand:- start:5426 stop:6292 length:867 start_codon:yes stop_codon:yes gene_type:complete
MTKQNESLGILLMIITTIVFASQDGLSKYLATEYNVYMVVMIRYWFFATFVISMSSQKTGGIKRVAKTKSPILQIFRSLILVAEMCITILAFTLLGLAETHAIFASYPLIIAMLSGPILGEYVGWRRWLAICVGFIGILIILNPGNGIFSPYALVPLAGAILFALYGLLTRYVGQYDNSSTSFFWTGVVGSIAMTIIGLNYWDPVSKSDWSIMLLLSASGVVGHYLLIKCYEVAEASAVQPFAYLQLIWASMIGIIIFGEQITTNVLIGACIIVGAGLFTLWRERKVS